MSQILGYFFNNWVRFVLALVFAKQLSIGFPMEIRVFAFAHSLVGFFIGFGYGLMVHRYFLGANNKRNIRRSFLAGFALLSHIGTTIIIVWFSPDTSEISRIFNLCLFIPLTHSALAVAYYIASRKTIPAKSEQEDFTKDNHLRLS